MKRAVIKPTNAASIWVEGDWVYLELPSPGGDKPHTIKVTADIGGLSKIVVLLHSRHPTSQLGEPGDPTQWHLDRKPKAPTPGKVRHVGKGYGKQRFSEEQHGDMRKTLEKLGMIND